MRGGDVDPQGTSGQPFSFNPRPRARGRLGFLSVGLVYDLFQSTPPCEGATRHCRDFVPTSKYQSTPPCEGATFLFLPVSSKVWFQSTPPCEGATISPTTEAIKKDVSIHAPVRGGDQGHGYQSQSIACFNPRPRARGRHNLQKGNQTMTGFNPRPRARGRPGAGHSAPNTRQFQSTPPCEGATFCPICKSPGPGFSIHAPVRGGDLGSLAHRPGCQIFNPRLRACGRLAPTIGDLSAAGFNPRPRARGRHRLANCI